MSVTAKDKEPIVASAAAAEEVTEHDYGPLLGILAFAGVLAMMAAIKIVFKL